MPCVRVLAAFGLAFVLSGCINSGTLIEVKPDGSGTIEQTMLMNIAALKSMMAGLDAQGKVKTWPVQRGRVQAHGRAAWARACASSRPRR